MTNIVRLGEGAETSEVFESKFTTHPITDYSGDDLSFYFDLMREDYKNAGIKVIGMNTYYNSGYNHATDTYDGPKEFGIEVEHA
jgi:hypothetical protein